MLSLTRPLGSDSSASVSALHEQHSTQLLSEVQKNVPVGTGFGYRVDGVLGDSAHADASLTYQNDGGTYSVDATRSHNATAVRADASGSIAWVDGTLFTTRHLDDSFALVRVPGFPNVGISIDNQASATTDANGNALIPRLRAYDINSVSIDPASLPLDAAIEATEKNLVPAYSSAALAVFVVTQSRSGTATLVRDDGSPIPAGARVVVNGVASDLPVGLDGRLYLTRLSEQTHVDVRWGEHVCHVALHVPPPTEPQARLGTFRCTESAK